MTFDTAETKPMLGAVVLQNTGLGDLYKTHKFNYGRRNSRPNSRHSAK